MRHFRNLGVQDLELPAEGLALVGSNAQGKSNFLESIYYLETFRSFRGARDDQLTAFGEGVFRIEGGLEGRLEGGLRGGHDRGAGGHSDPAGDRLLVAAAFQRQGRRKKITVGGDEPPRLADALGRLGAVVFSPADVAMINEGPAERRRFLDIVLSLNVPGYLRALQQYRHVLAQRSAALKDRQVASAVAVWDEPLVRAGAEVARARASWIAARGAAFSAYYAEVSGGQGAVIRYRPSVAVTDAAGRILDPTDAVEALTEALAASAGREQRMGTTVVGPHRDEMSISLEDERELDVRDFGSGGQRRTAALALRLVEALTIREARGLEPLVLMDDVFAELDAGRSERILGLIEREEAGQVILTAPKESDVRVRRDVLPRWGIRSGRIEA